MNLILKNNQFKSGVMKSIFDLIELVFTVWRNPHENSWNKKILQNFLQDFLKSTI